MSSSPIVFNPLFQLAADLVNQSCRNIFLTGKAGTGKTTFLKYILENCPKQMAVLAPTGVAAINAGGTTIHSFFQLPLAPFIPAGSSTGFSSKTEEVNDRHQLISRLRYNNNKRKLLQELELLIIDEISMVRCDLLDAVDTVLRHFRRRPMEQFGGVQVLLIGDLFQLPPVIKESEWQLFNGCYDTPYFFSSHVWKPGMPLYIEFEEIYRQSEEQFIRLLNEVRNNELTEEGMNLLESRYLPGARLIDHDNYIILTTHNAQARDINVASLNNLEGNAVQYKAKLVDDFPENAYPADEILTLKIGAQVMFLRNDTSDKGKRYFNGRIGLIEKLEEDRIIVKCPEDEAGIEVERETWENIRYILDPATRKLKEDVLGSFTQFPLRLAWAITIHKSQGLTFEKAIIDAGEAFAPGQVYVALSRCTHLEGMILRSKVKSSRLFTDQRIVEFARAISTSGKLQNELEVARRHYQEKILLTAFDFRLVLDNCHELQKYLQSNISSFNPEAISWLAQLTGRISALQDTAEKFQQWLKAQSQVIPIPEMGTGIHERVIKAASYYITETGAIIKELERSPAVTDSRLHAKEYNEILKEVFAKLSFTNYLLGAFNKNFNLQDWHRLKNSFKLPSFQVNAYAGTSQKQAPSPHPELYKQLKELRDSICFRKNLPVYLVVGGNTLDEMARYLPLSLSELEMISGFGSVKIKQYGQQFLDIILKYCDEKKLGSLIHEKKPKRERRIRSKTPKEKGASHAESFRLFKAGNSIAAIAQERKLAISTIEGHLCKFISNGEIAVHDLVSKEKIDWIEAALKNYEGSSTAPLKEKLPGEISYGEIRMVMAALGIRQQG